MFPIVSLRDKYSLRDLHKDFPTDEACVDFIFRCHHASNCSCGGQFRRMRTRRQYQCTRCRYQIAPTAGTIFHKSDTPLTLWFHAIWIFANAKSGISSKEMERQLGVTYKTAWRMLHLIRKALNEHGRKLRGVVEVDIGYLGGKGNAGKNNEYLSDVMKKKSVVTIAIERGGPMRAMILPDGTAENMRDFLTGNVEKGTILMTDGSKIYHKLSHERFSVNHSRGEYARGVAHINRVEAFIGHVKSSIRGTFKTVSKQHLKTYLDSFSWHHNNRHNDRKRFETLLGTLMPL